ncbi:MAG: polyphosphate kinase 1 [Flavobacteriaceae bacterium]|jgi:polyphosphate kinase|nr:polyphosphate kinase 1 [Flavobacteriaceae bacterium]MCI5088411.1 polyphosphate kinase 1 [Flavobacteriaceae bacterium]CAI8190220.1 MAG: Polyphosphate kinase [SAR116 cluster bacterium]
MTKNQYINREISWLRFNERVLQESADPNTPLIERFRFLGIFSNNLDEFFKVRYATVKRVVDAGAKLKGALGDEKPKALLAEITSIVIAQQKKSLEILNDIELELEGKNIFLINEKEVHADQAAFISDYFTQKVSPVLMTIILNDLTDFPTLKDTAAYLAVKMTMPLEESEAGTLSRIRRKKDLRYALIEIPKSVNRFVVLPREGDKQYIMMLDDIIRFNLDKIFNMFTYTKIAAHMIKITRDAELDMDNDLSKSFIEKIYESVEERKISDPVRFVYDMSIEKDTLKFLKDKMKIEGTDSVIPGGRYHNRRDYMSFPSLGREDLLYSKTTPLPVKGVPPEGSLLQYIAEKDFLQYTPYHTFSYITRFLKEAALDPKVKTIKITVYRLANNSQVAASLINAVKNGKQVTVQIELQARFDEHANIEYAEKLQAEGVKLIFGVRGLKVHSKICLIEREEGANLKRYGFVSTGNFNESTARIYTDYTLFTAHDPILKELDKVFDFFETTYKIHKYKHLIVSPHYTKNVFKKLIDKEIAFAKAGKEASIKIKMNSFTSYKMIDKLYEASRAGVKIQLIIRGICCLVPGIPGMSENIEVISVIDKFLEHTRLFIFGNDNDPKIYISSADWMTRNLDYRVEVGCPIYDTDIKKELIDTFNMSWEDNTKSRWLTDQQESPYRKLESAPLRSQFAMYDYYKNQLEN